MKSNKNWFSETLIGASKTVETAIKG